MKRLQQRGRAALAALLLASLAAGVSAAPVVSEPDDRGSWVAWIDDWLARLVPGWASAGDASEEPPPPSGGGIAFDDPANSETCDSTITTTCTGGDGLPDMDPDG